MSSKNNCVIKLNFTERQFSIDYRLLEPVGSYIHKEERQHTGVDMYRNVDTRVTRKWLAYLVPADLSDLLCHTGRHRISYSLKLKHQTLDNNNYYYFWGIMDIHAPAGNRTRDLLHRSA